MLNKKRLVSLIVLTIFIALLSSSIVFALYTNQAYKKGVVSTMPKDPLFSSLSDTLRQYSYSSAVSNRNDKALVIQFSNSDSYGFSIINQGIKSGSVNQKDIQYTIKFDIELRNPSVSGDYYPVITIGNETPVKMTGMTYTADTQILLGRNVNSIEYNIKFPETAIDNIILKVEAKPISSGGYAEAAGGILLYREFIPTRSSTLESAVFKCEGRFDDLEEQGASVDDFVAFNYSISVENGAGSTTLTWDHTHLKIDDSFVQSIGIAPIVDNVTNKSTLVFQVDSDVKDLYEIVFYRTGEEIASKEDLMSYVDFSYREPIAES